MAELRPAAEQMMTAVEGREFARVALPDADREVEGRVPMPVLEEVADRHAREVWGAKVARGAAFPVTDPDGAVVAYVFSYARGAREHPSVPALLDEVAGLQAAAEGDAEKAARARDALSDLAARFGAIYVSARTQRDPILLVRHHLHPFFLVACQARKEAARELGRTDVTLERICFADAADESLEFAGGDARVVVPARQGRFDTRTAPRAPGLELPAEKDVADAEPAADAEDAWRRVVLAVPPVLGRAAAPVEKKITYWGLVPPIPYTWWCVPTAYSMVMGFWDHYVAGIGSFSGHGRIIDHWYEHSTWAHRADGWDAKVGDPGTTPNNVPPFIDELIDPATGTWRAGFQGIADFVDKTYQYKVTVDDQKVGSGNDWDWAAIIAEVDAGRPFIWCFAAHAVVGIGYRVDSTGQRYVIYLDTYGATLAQKLKELPYSQGKSRAFVVPDAGDGPVNVTLLVPRGGGATTSSTPSEVIWSDDGGASTTIDLSYSGDAGGTWTALAPSLPAHSGLNRYRWLPSVPMEKARLRVQAYAGSTRLCGDGSVENVMVTSQTAAGHWTKISGPTGLIVAGYDKQRATRAIYATDLDTGDIFQFEGKAGASWNWFKIGGPGQAFVLDGQGKLYGLSPGGDVWQYTGTPLVWKQIGGAAAALYPDVDGVCATHPVTGDLMRYLGAPFAWRRVGGPGKAFTSDAMGRLYGLSPNGGGVWRYDGLFGQPVAWTKIGGPATNLYGRGYGVYATDSQSGAIRFYHGYDDLWTTVGTPGKTFSVDAEGRLYGLSPDASGVWRYDGSFSAPLAWSKIGGPAGTICAGWREVLATDPQTNDLWIYGP